MTAETTLPRQFNFAQYIIETNADRGQRTAYIDDLGKMNYEQLSEALRRVATGLQALGLRREERILLVMQDCIDWPVAFLGALYAGIVPVAVNTLLTAKDYAYMLSHSRAKAVLVSGSLLPVMQEAMRQSVHEVAQIIVSRPEGDLPTGALEFQAFCQQHSPATQACPTQADEAAFWLYSSGSTGTPKGTVHTHANPWWTAHLYAKPILGMTENDVVFSAAKLFFAYGLGNALSFPLSVGASVVLLPGRPTPEACFQRMVDLQPTIFCGAPTGYAGLLAAPNLPARSDVALRLCSSAGEALPRDIGERFTEHFGCEIIDGIGSTEMLHIFLSNRPGEVRYGTTGKVVPGYEVELRNEDGTPVALGEIGDLYIKGPSSALMYWQDRARSRSTFQGEWTKSGDKYSCDADGYYTYAGRSDDMLKVSGQYVSPFEVEATLVQHEAVLEAAVIGVNDNDGLTRTKAFVVLRPGIQPCSELDTELKTFVKARLAPHKYPRHITFVEDLPKTATGKIQRFRLRALEAGEPA